MSERGGGVGQRLLGGVDLGTLQRFQPGDLVERQVGEQLEKAAHVGILRVPPELPVVVGRQRVGVEPDGALGGLAHLAAVRRGDQRGGQAEHLLASHAAGELNAVDDVAPLVGATHLEAAVDAAGELQEVIALEDHVVELEEAQRLLAIEA